MGGLTNECSYATVGGGGSNDASGLYVVCLLCLCLVLARPVNVCCFLRAFSVVLMLYCTALRGASRHGVAAVC